MIRGSCLCGQIRYQLDGGVELIRWASGEELIQQYQSSPGNVRAFCRVRGSNMPVVEDGGEVNIPAGTLDDDPGVRPVVNIFAGSKAPWFDIEDSLPRFDEFPPAEFWKSVTTATKP